MTTTQRNFNTQPFNNVTNELDLQAIRYVITPEALAFVTLLGTGTKFVVQASFFRNLLGLHSRTVLGSTSVKSSQLLSLGLIPTRKEVVYDDARLSVC